MTWVKIDDQFHAHPKVIHVCEECPAALALHVRALSHCAAYLTDGAVSEPWVKAIVPKAAERRRQVAALLGVGMWEPADGGWQIHDYLDFNDSREDVLAERRDRADQRSQAGRRGARRRWQNGSSPNGEHMPPSRPVPDLFPQLAG